MRITGRRSVKEDHHFVGARILEESLHVPVTVVKDKASGQYVVTSNGRGIGHIEVYTIGMTLVAIFKKLGKEQPELIYSCLTSEFKYLLMFDGRIQVPERYSL